MDESKIYVFEAAQEEALAQGIVPLLAPALSSWQPESQAAAAQALANVAYRNPAVRKELARIEVGGAGRPPPPPPPPAPPPPRPGARAPAPPGAGAPGGCR